MGLRELLSEGREAGAATARDVLAEARNTERRTMARNSMQVDKAWIQVERHLQQVYEKRDKERRDMAMMRRKLYDGRGLDLELATIDSTFKNLGVRDLYKQFAPFAQVNYLRRKTRERSRLYAKAPRVRAVAGERDNENYQWLQEVTNHNMAMKFADETTDYQNDTFWLFRVRQTPRGLEPRTDILGPECFFPICDPKDQTKLYGVGIDCSPVLTSADPTVLTSMRAKAHWIIWSDDESFSLNASWQIIRSSIEPNPFACGIPGVLINNGYRDRQLLDPFTGQEAVATHLSLWLQETMKLKGIASKTRQAVFTGETGNSPQGQAQDDTVDFQVAEGVGVTTIERGIDVLQFISAMDHTEERAAASEGIPPQVLRHAGATSGYEMDLRRIPLEEIREDRVDVFRRGEKRFAEVQSAVMAVDMPERGFSTDGWHMDFSEIKRPMQEKEKWEVRQVKRKMGHSDPVTEAMEDNPDFDEEQARVWVEERMRVQAEFEEARAMRNMAANPMIPGRTPQMNGAMGGAMGNRMMGDDEHEGLFNVEGIGSEVRTLHVHAGSKAEGQRQ